MSLLETTTERYFGNWKLEVTNDSTPIPDIVDDPISPNKRAGVLRLQSGTTQYMKTVLSLPKSRVILGNGPVSIRFAFSLSRFATGGITDNYSFGIGLAADPQSTFDDVLMLWVPSYYDNQSILARSSFDGSTSEGGLTGGSLNTAGVWDDFEILVNADATVTSYYAASRLGRAQPSGGYNTTNIPAGIPLTPFIMMEKKGSAAATNDIAYIDYVKIVYNPLGVSGV